MGERLFSLHLQSMRHHSFPVLPQPSICCVCLMMQNLIFKEPYNRFIVGDKHLVIARVRVQESRLGRTRAFAWSIPMSLL